MAIELVETVVALCGYGTTKSCDISPCFQRGALAFLRIDFLILDTLPYFRHLFNFFFSFSNFLLHQHITLRNVLQSRSTRRESRAQKYCTLAEGEAPHVRDEGHFCTIFILSDDLALSMYFSFPFIFSFASIS